MPYGVSRRAAHPGRPKGRLSVGLIWALLPFERSGTTTADLVRGNRPGTFNGTPAWSNGPRGPVISFGATTDYLSAGTAAFLPTTANFSLVLSWRKTDSTNRNSNPFGELAGVIAQRCQAHVPYSDGTVYFDYGGSTNGTTRVQAAGLTFGDDIWVFTVGQRGMEIWQNGYIRASNTARPTRTASSAGWNINKASSPGDLATTSGVLVYDRQLTPNEIATLTADISAPFRPTRRRIAAKAPAGGGVTVTPAAATITFTGTTPTVATPRTVTPAAATIAFSGTVPTVSTPRAVTPDPATIAFTGTTPTVATPRVVTPAAATIAFTGTVPTVATSNHVTVAPDPATIVFAGAVPTVTAGQSAAVTPGPATIVFSGTVPVVTVAAVPSTNDDGGPTPPSVGNRKPRSTKPTPPTHRVFDTYSSQPSPSVVAAQAAEQQRTRVRNNRIRAAALAAVLAASEDDYGF